MPLENTGSFLSPIILDKLMDWVILIIFILYAIFALLIVRQVDLMTKALITPVSPIVKAISIIHAGFAIGLIVLVLGVI